MSRKKYVPRVKVCGITNLEDAEAAIRFGVDAIGFVFSKSPRKIAPKMAKQIVQSIGPWVSCVGVFVDEDPAKILDIAMECKLDTIQLHGDESPLVCRQLSNFRVIKTFKVSNNFSYYQMKPFNVDACLLETDHIKPGGTGKAWNWKKLAKEKFESRIIVTGGLKPSNVKEAIKTLRPYGVDVASGVEKKPGVKSHPLMEKFIQNAKNAI